MTPHLPAMLDRAARHQMTPEEQRAQRRSWVIGEMLIAHPEMTRADAERIVDGVIG